MKISVFYSYLTQAVSNGEIKSTAEAFSQLVPKGVAAFDLASTYFDKKTPDELSKTAKDNGVSYSSVYDLSKNFQYKNPDILKEMKERTKVNLYKTAQIGCPLFLPIPSISGSAENAQDMDLRKKVVYEYFNDVTEAAKEFGITTIIENSSSLGSPFSSLQNIDDILKTIPDIRIAFDTANFWFAGEDLLEVAKKIAEKTAHVHLKDIMLGTKNAVEKNGKKGESCAIGRGIIPIKQTVNHLKTNGYDGYLSIEIGTSVDIYKKVLSSLEYVKTILW